VLNLYRTGAGCFDPRTRRVAQLFASYARMGLMKAKSENDLNQALVSRKDIGTAIGIVMERYGLSEDRAFAYLVRLSRSRNTKLRTVARQLVDDTQVAHGS
jgi:AmiR/NasT family two-component response regulator